MNNIIREGLNDIRTTTAKLRNHNIKGPAKQIIKNSSYQLVTNLIAKFGSLAFTIIIARLLAPKLFGLYSLSISTIVLFSILSDLGIGTTFLVFASKAFGENNLDKTKTYFKELLKYKYYLLASTSFLIVTGGYFLAKYYYAKPIYYALLAGAIYIPVVGIISYLTSAFQVENNYRYPMYKEVIFQIIRFTVVPLGILFLLKDGITNSALMGMIILLLSFSYLVGFLYLIITAKQKIKFLRAKERKLTHKEKMQLKDFILPLSLTALGGIVFGYIDTLMLGHYVTAGFIGYYSAAFGLIGAASAIMGFLSGGALPVFSQEKKKDLESTFKKIRNIILLIGTASFVFTLLIAKYILLIYGSDYGPATTILRILAILLITGPIVQIYNSYFISIKKPEVIAKILILSTLINIVLNVGLINYGISVGGMIGGCYGAAIATIIARGFYLVEIIIIKKKLC